MSTWSVGATLWGGETYQLIGRQGKDAESPDLFTGIFGIITFVWNLHTSAAEACFERVV